MGIAEWTKLALVLARTGAEAHASEAACPEVEEYQEEKDGIEVGHYRSRAGTGPTLVLAHGFTLNGKDDPRLRAFARNLARVGATCVVPSIPGLQRLSWEPADVDVLAALLAGNRGAQGVGLVGFSFGASYALLAAARVPARARFVISVGGYASLPEVYDHIRITGKMQSPTDTDNWLYLKLAMAFRNQNQLALSEEDSALLRQLLACYCDGKQMDVAQSFFQRVLAQYDLEALDSARQDRAILAGLSPAGQMAALACKVVLIHDPDDTTVPAAQSRQLQAELERASHCPSVKLQLTSLLSHVTLSNAWRPVEALRLMSLLAPLVEC